MDGDRAVDTGLALGGPADNKLSRLIFNARGMSSSVKELIPEDWTVGGRGLQMMELLVGNINAQDEQAGADACDALVHPVPVAEEEAHLLAVWVQRWKKMREMCVRCKTEPLAVQLRDSLKKGVENLPTLTHAVSTILEEHHASAKDAVEALLKRIDREALKLSSKKMQTQDSWVLLPSGDMVPRPREAVQKAQVVQGQPDARPPARAAGNENICDRWRYTGNCEYDRCQRKGSHTEENRGPRPAPMCNRYRTMGRCTYGSKCIFSHGGNEDANMKATVAH